MNNKTYILISSILMIIGLVVIAGMMLDYLPWADNISLIIGVALLLLAGVVRMVLYKEDQ